EILVSINDRDPQYHDIYRVNLDSGERELVQKNTEFAGFTVDDDYHVRLASKLTPDGGNLIMKPDGKGGWSEFLKIGMADSLTTNPLGFDKTGDVLYMLDSRGRDTAALTSIDLKSDKQTVIAEDAKADAGGIMAHPTEQTIQAVSFTYERTHWVFKDKAVEED